MVRVHLAKYFWMLIAILSFSGTVCAEDWAIVLSPSLKNDAAVLAACEDITTYGKSLGISLEIFDSASKKIPNSHSLLLVGAEIADVSKFKDTEGFEIDTKSEGSKRFIRVVGGSPIGNAYGVYWIWDRMRVHKRIPDINTTRTPYMRVRFSNGNSEQVLREALRYSANWVSTVATMETIPWGAEPEDTDNAKTREALRPLIAKAHEYHMKFLSTGDEIAFHPAFMKEMGATFNPGDPKLWDALQEKYRRLLTAMPELDGVRIRVGEFTRIGGNYLPYNVMHDGEAEGWTLDRRYRTFVQKVHEVVVGEFDKIYYHRTWVTTANEQHSDPEVYKSIFTDEVPTKNLYLSPYLSLADRWYYQPYNPTFNQTPHNMVVLLAGLDYHAHSGIQIFPSFPGDYHQGGVQGILEDPDTNLTGFHFGTLNRSSQEKKNWNTLGITTYTVFRLAWDPYEDLMDIARDYASIYVGPEAAPELGELLLLAQRAYIDGIYIKPVAESIRGNTLPHLRMDSFRLYGIPQIDKGYNHLEWLRASMYEPSIGKIGESIEYLDSGLGAARELLSRYEALEPTIADQEMAQYIGDGVRLTFALVETNTLYVKTVYEYFRYREAPTAIGKARLAKHSQELKTACERFKKQPNFTYKLSGIEQFLLGVDAVLEDLEQAEAELAKGINENDIKDVVQTVQKKYATAWSTYGAQAKPLAHWQGRIDGIDIVRMQGNAITTEHIKHDPPLEITTKVIDTLPQQAITVLIKPIRSQRDHPFILSQPTAANDYTVEIYCYNRPAGYDWWEFELYYVEQSPASLGLKLPWR